MIIIQHRVESISALCRVPPAHGVEVDVRERGGRLIVAHDAFKDGEDFAAYLEHYQHQLLIVNVKTDGVEDAVRVLLRKHGVVDYLFLDVAPPRLICMARAGERNLCLRYSEYEPVVGLDSLLPRVDWVWVDCFEPRPAHSTDIGALRRYARVCLVSPELAGHRRDCVSEWKDSIRRSGWVPDAVCTDQPDSWAELMEIV